MGQISAKEHTGREMYPHLILEKLSISVILVDRDFNMVYYNQKARDITGLNLDLYLGKSIIELIRFRNVKGRKLDLGMKLDSIFSKTSEPVYDITCRYSHPDETELWLSLCFFPLENKDDEIRHVAICFSDITQTKEIEASLKELEIRYETVFNAVNDGIFIYEPGKFRLIDVNDRIVDLYGYSKKELKNKRIEDLSIKEEGFTNRRGILYALRAFNGDIKVVEWHARNKAGIAFWTRLTFKRVIIDEEPFLMGIIKDIEAQKKAELSLMDSEEQYRALAQNSPDVILRFDRSLRYLYVNDAIKNIFQVEPVRFLNKTHKEMGLFSPEMSDFLEDHISRVFTTGKPVEVGFYIDTLSGRIYIEWRLFPEYDNKGEIYTVLAVARDITEKKQSQENLRKSEERLQFAHEVISDGMWDWDIRNEQIYYSPRFFTMLGYESDEYEQTPESIYMLMHPDDREKVIKAYDPEKFIASDSIELESRGRRKDGTYAWILMKGKVFARDEQGLPTRIVGTTVDISHRKRQEEIRNVLINISDAVNTTRSLDEFFERIQFFLAKVIDTKNCYIALYDKVSNIITLPFHRDERDKFKEFPAGRSITAYVIRTGLTQLLNSEQINGLSAVGEIEIIGAPAVSWLGVPLRIENELIGVFVVQSYDESVIFTEDDVRILEFVSDQIALTIARKKDQDSILENQVRQRQIFESLPDGLLVTSGEGLIIDYNSRIKEMLNCRDKEIKNSNLRQFIAAAGLNRITEIYKKTLDTGFAKQEEIRMVRDDMSEFYAEISAGLIHQAIDKPETFVITIKNIDERKAYEINLKIAKEKAEESDRLKTAFLSNMSHEIRTPMNAIIGFAELLSRGEIADNERREFISQINYGAESLMRLIDDIIDIAKIEAGQIRIYNTFFDISSIFRDLKLMFTKNLQRLNKQHLKIVEDNNGIDPSIQLFGDQIRIRQILNNLLSNAIKFTEKGEIRFGIRKISDGMISFYVKDTGIGIPQEKLDIIFDRFRQGHESRNRLYGGTGLGLAISKHLVELMGGKIMVNSEKGMGSEFEFSIPYISFGSPETGNENIFNKIKLDWQSRTILIAEDEVSGFLLLQEILKPTRIRILWAKDGEEAVELFDVNPHVDLILMDVQLPNINGYDATRKIKEKKPDVPVIALTANAISGEKQESIKAGCDDYISKPVRINDLFIVLSKFLPG